ncbi:hypothetical protein F0562_022843 [Nyssa sinensis]|uniref:RNase III domain-containing protein n=1 Tax=Nyssa sinensis TaxID=561372 RepID=A0A5J5BKK4_9ASTE|nr:hypothetical protein F0562_022843 [Nyssa sinensis]
MATALPILPPKVKASWDTQQRLPYNRQRTLTKTPPSPNTLTPTTTTKPAVTLTTLTTRMDTSLPNLNNRNPRQVKLEEAYLGYERWLPSPPKVEKPRSIYNAASLAYIGDCIYELYARRHFLFPPLNIEEYNDHVMAVVRCEAQDALLQKLLNDKYLSEEERDVLRWGKNIGAAKTRTKKRAGAAVYNRASSLETLIGYLYLTNVETFGRNHAEVGILIRCFYPVDPGRSK